MAASKKATHIVTHPKLRLMVGGTMERIPLGKQIALSAKIGDRLIEKGFVKSIDDDETVDVGGVSADKEMADVKKIIEASEAKAKKAEAEVKKLANEKANLEAEVKKLTEANK